MSGWQNAAASGGYELILRDQPQLMTFVGFIAAPPPTNTWSQAVCARLLYKVSEIGIRFPRPTLLLERLVVHVELGSHFFGVQLIKLTCIKHRQNAVAL